jgi:TIR domain
MDYERGLAQLKQLLRGTTWEHEFQVYEARLRENLADDRLFGSTPQTQADRNRITRELNRLAAHVNTSFNDLCQPGNTLNLQTPPNFPRTTGKNAQAQPPNIKPSSQRTKAYISFHPRDKPYLDELHTQLDQFARKGLINYWDRSKMSPGAVKYDEITNALRSTKIAIVLISADFLAAEPPDPIATLELPTLLSVANNQEIVLLNVILSHCAFEYSELEPFHTVNSQPLSELNQSKRAKIWLQVATQALNILSSVP